MTTSYTEATPAPNRAQRRLVDVNGAAAHLATTVPHVRRLVAKREIPFTRVGRKIRLDLNALDRWLDENAR